MRAVSAGTTWTLGLTLGGQIQQQALLLCEHLTDLFYLVYLYLLL